MRWRFLLGASLFWALAVVLGARAVLRPHIWLETTPATTPEGTATVSYSEPGGEKGDVVVGPVAKTIITWLKIKYLRQIDATSSETVTAEVSQAEIITNLMTRQSSEPSGLPTLAKPVRMSLECPALDFGNDGNVRFLPGGTKTPAILTWTPIPRQAGQVTLILRLKNVFNVKVSVNDEPKDFKDNDDIPLTVDVRTVHRLTPFLESWLV
jgi:hypothetical protein